MAVDLSNPVTLGILVALGAFVVYWWLKWQWRVAWFDRALADARSRAREESREESADDRPPTAGDDHDR